MTLGRRLRSRLDDLGLSQKDLADKLNISTSTLNGYFTDYREPSKDMLVQLARHLDASVDYLLGTSDEIAPQRPRRKGVKIPVLGYVAAGIPIEAIEDILDYEEIPEEMAATGDFYALQIRGDSMEPDIREGDIVIMRKQSCVDSGQIAVVLINGDDATVKRIKVSESGIMLVPNNSKYEPMFFTNEEVNELPVIVIGRVMELRRTL